MWPTKTKEAPPQRGKTDPAGHQPSTYSACNFTKSKLIINAFDDIFPRAVGMAGSE